MFFLDKCEIRNCSSLQNQATTLTRVLRNPNCILMKIHDNFVFSMLCKNFSLLRRLGYTSISQTNRFIYIFACFNNNLRFLFLDLELRCLRCIFLVLVIWSQDWLILRTKYVRWMCLILEVGLFCHCKSTRLRMLA